MPLNQMPTTDVEYYAMQFSKAALLNRILINLKMNHQPQFKYNIVFPNEQHRVKQNCLVSGEWEVGSGKWEVGSGEWEVGSGKWEVNS
jgi:hypothetical protein